MENVVRSVRTNLDHFVANVTKDTTLKMMEKLVQVRVEYTHVSYVLSILVHIEY